METRQTGTDEAGNGATEDPEVEEAERGTQGRVKPRCGWRVVGVRYILQIALLLLLAQDQQGTTQQDHDGGDGNVDKYE